MNWENFQLGTHCHRKQLEFPIFGSETKIYNSVEPCSAHILHEYQQHEGILYNFKVKGGKRIGCGQQLTSVSAFWFFYFKGKLSQSLCCIDSVRPLPIQYRVYTIDYSAQTIDTKVSAMLKRNQMLTVLKLTALISKKKLSDCTWTLFTTSSKVTKRLN